MLINPKPWSTISLVFISLYFYFAVSKNFTLNFTHYFIMKIQELQILILKTIEIFTKMYCKTIFVFSYWYYSYIRKFFTFQKESFRKNIKVNHNNYDKIKNEIYNTILTEKQEKYQYYHHVKCINMNILQVKKYCLLIKTKIRTS